MRPDQRYVSTLPLTELWDDRGAVSAHRIRELMTEGIRTLLRTGEVSFVIADVGKELTWVAKTSCFEFWAEHVKRRVVDNPASFCLENYPDKFSYTASEWSSSEQTTIVLLEKHH